MIGVEERRWDCHNTGNILGQGGGTTPTDVPTHEWQYLSGHQDSSGHHHWLYGDHIRVVAGRHGPYASLEIAVGKHMAPVIVAMGCAATLALLTVVAVTVRRRHRAATEAQGGEHVRLSEFEDHAQQQQPDVDEEGSAGSSDEQERHKLTATM
jgi:hypothetical protein